MRTVMVVAVALLVVAALVAVSLSLGQTSPPGTERPASAPDCKASGGPGAALCVERRVTRVIDGDTLDVEGGLRIRLVLVDAPELSEPPGAGSKEYLTDLCLGRLAVIDEDDGQVGDDPYGRVLAVVSCDGTHANAAMIYSGHATTYFLYCSASEFANEAWTGCASPPPPPPPAGNCDPAYPDVCIPSLPPDLDCPDIDHLNFRVLPPDPHGFDGDGDGIGCES